jgi:hypothetical protein
LNSNTQGGSSTRKSNGSVIAHGILRSELLPIFLLLGLGLAVGFSIATDYGVSTDEPRNADVGAAALKAYTGSQDYFLFDTLEEHGPVYFMFFSATSNALVRIFHGWQIQDGRHFTNYVTFLVGLFFFYSICVRLVRRVPALVATALFGTQPLMFGSAFINQKDIPFTVVMLAVIALGLRAAERGHVSQEQDPVQSWAESWKEFRNFADRIRGDWWTIPPWRRRGLLAGSLLAVALVVDLFLTGVLHRLGVTLVTAAYNGRAPWPIQPLFSVVATDAYKTPLGLYLGRYEVGFKVIRFAVTGVALAAGLIAYARSLPTLAHSLRGRWSNEGYPSLLAGAAILGCAISIRQIGLFAGVLVSAYALYRGRQRAIVPLCVYWIVAGLVTYATWPYLWSDPIRNALSTFTVIENFGNFEVFFRGQVYHANALPWDYFPTLAGLQLTEPALLLIGVGTVVLARRTWERRTNVMLVGLLAAWFGAPVFWLIYQRIPIYNSIRHFFFVLPPLFVSASVGIEAVLALIRRGWIWGLVIILGLAPGIWGIVQLHPYEYSYFNSLAGGISGAYEHFEEDYWCLSLKEAMDFVNVAEPYGGVVRVLGSVQSAAPFARGDLRRNGLRSPIPTADMVVVCPVEPPRTWDNSGFKIIHEVTRGRAVLTEVWQRMSAAADPPP